MQSQMKKPLRGLSLLMLGGAGFALVLSGCVTYYGKEPYRYPYQRESVSPPVVESPVIAEPAEPIPVFQQPPLMAWDSRFGMYFVLGSPNDLFFYGGYYYVFANGGWDRSVSYNGPWLYTERDSLPPVFQSHRLEDLRHNREVIYREYKMRPNAFRERMFDHHEDRFRDHYDRGFMERNREQMRRDREFYAHHESPTNRNVSERHGPPVANHEALGQKQVKKPVGKPPAQKTVQTKPAPEKPVDKPEEKK